MAKSTTVKLLVVTDKRGKVVGAAPAESSRHGFQIQIEPLPGQKVHELTAKVDIKKLMSGPDEMKKWLDGQRLSGRTRSSKRSSRKK